MTPTVWISLLSVSAWAVINTLVAAWVIRKKTSAETVKVAKESDVISQEAEDKIYDRLSKQLSDAITRAGNAETHAEQAVTKANLQGARMMILVKMFEKHIAWDQAVRKLLIELGAHGSDIPPAPFFNPYEVLTADEQRIDEILLLIDYT